MNARCMIVFLSVSVLLLPLQGCVHGVNPPIEQGDVSETATPTAEDTPESPALAAWTEPAPDSETSAEPSPEDELLPDEVLTEAPATPRDDTVPRHWPVAHESRHVISEYGQRSSGFHKGIDIKAPMGVPVIAAATGTVTESGRGRGYGQYVLIEHSPEFSTLYGHLKSRLVEAGDRVVWGDTIGLLGASGNASTQHVHFEVIWNGDHANPAIFLPAWEYIPGYEPEE